MTEIRPYIAGDARLIQPGPGMTVDANDMLAAGYGLPPGEAWTIWEGLEPVACGGLAPVWAGRFIAWTYVGQPSRASWIAMHRACRRRLDEGFARGEFRRVEASVLAEFLPGSAWLEHLGFQSEGRMRAYGPDGADHWAFARTK